MYNTQTPFAASYVIVKNDEGLMAFVLRENTSWMNGYYSLPAGKTEKRESFRACAAREAKEEIGISVEPSDLKHAITVHRYSISDDAPDTEWIDILFEVIKYSGTVRNAEPHIHSEVAWLDPRNLPVNVIPPLKATVEALARGERYFEYGYEK